MTLVYVEYKNGRLTEGAQSALTAAATFGRPINAIALGNVDVEALKPFGVETVHHVSDDRLNTFAPTAAGKAVYQIVSSQPAATLVGPSSAETNEVLARAAALGDYGFASACTELQPEGESVKVTRVIWGGSLFQEATLTGAPKLITVDASAFAPQPSGSGAANVEAVSVEFSDADFVDQLRATEKGEKEGSSLTEAKVVVGGGRGMGSEEAFGMLEELADLLGGAVGGSRVATNNGWRPHSDQIGQTGAQIAPDVYLAFGISGAIQHMVGCKGTKNIIAINKDADAPIFQRAQYGVLGDLHEIAPALIEALKQAKSG